MHRFPPVLSQTFSNTPSPPTLSFSPLGSVASKPNKKYWVLQ